MLHPLRPHLTALTLVFSLFSVNSAYAGNKVVIIPLAGDAPPSAYSAFANYAPDQTLSNSGDIALSLSLTAPANGNIIINTSATAFAYVDSVSVQCSISTSSNLEIGRATWWRRKSASDSSYGPMALTRGFNVTAGTAYTFSLICKSSINNKGGISGIDLTAIFSPSMSDF